MWIVICVAFVIGIGAGFLIWLADRDVVKLLALGIVILASAIIVCTATTGVKAVNQEKEMEMPERIDASPEEIAQRVLRQKPKNDWRYLEEKEDKECNASIREEEGLLVIGVMTSYGLTVAGFWESFMEMTSTEWKGII